MNISRDAKIGVICRGGPVNGPYAAGVLRTLKWGLADKGLAIANLYGNSASAPDVVLSSVCLDDIACETWATVRPSDLIREPSDWLGRARTVWRLMYSEAIFDDSPLELLARRLLPLDDVFAPRAFPVKIHAVDYLTGQPIIFSNKNPKHKANFLAGVLGSMALVPFLRAQIAYDVVEAELLAEPFIRSGPFRDIAVLMDGGFQDNLMLDEACADGNDVVFLVDIEGMALGSLVTHRWDHWSLTLQRAAQILINVNDRRRYSGVERTNKILEVRDRLRQLRNDTRFTSAQPQIDRILDLLQNGSLQMAEKHPVDIIHVADRASARAYDFANFTTSESLHLIRSGERAARRVLDGLQLV